jgi:hypothetical protein
MGSLVMSVIGAQYLSPSANDRSAIPVIEEFIASATSTPFLLEITSVTENKRAFNIAILSY